MKLKTAPIPFQHYLTIPQKEIIKRTVLRSKIAVCRMGWMRVLDKTNFILCH